MIVNLHLLTDYYAVSLYHILIKIIFAYNIIPLVSFVHGGISTSLTNSNGTSSVFSIQDEALSEKLEIFQDLFNNKTQ